MSSLAHEYFSEASEEMWTRSTLLLSNTTHSHCTQPAAGQNNWILRSSADIQSLLTPSATSLQTYTLLTSAHVHTYTGPHSNTHTHTHTQYSCCVSNPERPELWEQGECSVARHNGVSHSRQNLETHTHRKTDSWQGRTDARHTQSDSS